MTYRAQFVEFLCSAGALTFGSFTTKSGRKTPYFVNTGLFRTGKTIAELGRFYAQHLMSLQGTRYDVLFGPAYKGIPLVVSTAIALADHHQKEVPFAFDRKEAKTHGDGGRFVGHQFTNGQRVVLVEDVITAGTTIREMVPLLQSVGVAIDTVIISVDRCERGSSDLTAVEEVRQSLGIRVEPIITVHDIIKHLESGFAKRLGLGDGHVKEMYAYLEMYGARG